MGREKELSIVIKAIETQPYNIYAEQNKYNKKPEDPEDEFNGNVDLKEFFESTWRSEDRKELFEHVGNRILDALGQSQLEEEDKPRLIAKCEQCGASMEACNAQAKARNLAEAFYVQSGKTKLEARMLAFTEYPDLRKINKLEKETTP